MAKNYRDEIIELLDKHDPEGGCYDPDDRESFWGRQADAILDWYADKLDEATYTPEELA